MRLHILGNRTTEDTEDAIKAAFLVCLAPPLSRRTAERWWRRFENGLAARASARPSFPFIYEFTERLCASERLPGSSRRQIRLVLAQACHLPPAPPKAAQPEPLAASRPVLLPRSVG